MKKKCENQSIPILSIDGVSKKFCRGLKRSLAYGIKDIFGEITGTRKSQPALRASEFWAVNNVSFQLFKGDAIGLVGANGSGKTTLLRMISGLIKPDTGEIKVAGRVVPLIALGAGFNPILTGRENIYVNLAILGLSKIEINQVIDDVISFAEISDALDSPVQTYSSGMAARLGFSCAVHAKAEVLLIDEVLSVGDMRFRSKCYRRLAELREEGTSFILVSHNTNAILSMCNKAIYLSKGRQVMTDTPAKVMPKFEEDLCLTPNTNHSASLKLPIKSIDESSGLDIIEVVLFNKAGPLAKTLFTAELAGFCIKLYAHIDHNEIIVSMLIKELSGESETVLHISSDKQNHLFDFKQGENLIGINFPELAIRPGLYTAKIYVHKAPFYMLDAIESYVFKVDSNIDMNQSLFFQKTIWN
jgi:lipopolysaccharide transport system ATP-binding protein